MTDVPNDDTNRVSVVIPTWNRKDLVLDCVASLKRQTFQEFEVLVVDDGSTDGTAQALEERFPDVRLVRLPENRGFCVAINAGIRAAAGDLVLLLNNDIVLEPGFLDALVKAADSSKAALFAPLLFWRDAPDVIHSAGDSQYANGRPESIGFRCPAEGFRFPETIFGASAAAGLFRRAVFDRVGVTDERFVAYFEDSDLCFRARLAGFGATFVPDAVGYHIGSASIAGRTWWRTRQCYRNHALLVVKNMPLWLLVKNAHRILGERVHQARQLFSAARCEFGAIRAAGMLALAWCSILRQVPHALAERRRIQHNRTITCRELESMLSK